MSAHSVEVCTLGIRSFGIIVATNVFWFLSKDKIKNLSLVRACYHMKFCIFFSRLLQRVYVENNDKKKFQTASSNRQRIRKTKERKKSHTQNSSERGKNCEVVHCRSHRC